MVHVPEDKGKEGGHGDKGKEGGHGDKRAVVCLLTWRQFCITNSSLTCSMSHGAHFSVLLST